MTYKAIFKTSERTDSRALLEEFQREMSDKLRVVYPKLEDWKGITVYDRGGTNLLEDLPVLRRLLEQVGMQHVTGVHYFNLKAGAIQHRHRDMYGNLLFGCSRIHVALQTHPRAFLEVQKIKYHLPENELWCLDTAGVHRAMNEGAQDRIHLVVDVKRAAGSRRYFPPWTLDTCLHLVQFVLIMTWKVGRDVLTKPASLARRAQGLFYVLFGRKEARRKDARREDARREDGAPHPAPDDSSRPSDLPRTTPDAQKHDASPVDTPGIRRSA